MTGHKQSHKQSEVVIDIDSAVTVRRPAARLLALLPGPEYLRTDIAPDTLQYVGAGYKCVGVSDGVAFYTKARQSS